MSRVTTIITGPDGKATTVVTRRSGCGCLTALAAVVVLFGRAAWFPLPLAIVAYVVQTDQPEGSCWSPPRCRRSRRCRSGPPGRSQRHAFDVIALDDLFIAA
jgi:hypothetical protein